MDDFNFQDFFAGMSLRSKIELLFKANHYIIGKFTVMDLTILLLVFTGVGYALDKATDLDPLLIVLIPGVLCVIIEYYRIKWRRVKTLQYVEQKAEKTRQLMDRYMEEVRQHGDGEMLEQALQLKQKVDDAEALMHDLTGIAFAEDVLGFSDDE